MCHTLGMFSPRPNSALVAASLVLGLGALAAPALAQPDPSGILFSTIGSPNNPAYHGPDPEQLVTGRGSVGYEYKIGTTEVTTAQWAEFYSAFYFQLPQGRMPLPNTWGAGLNTSGQFVPVSEAAAMYPVSGVSWRTCAMFCNWLCNDKRTDLSAIQNGAYDISTFGSDANGNFTDQPSHNPGARYWIPTLDESLKASFWSPSNTNNDGWYMYPLGRDTPPVYGPPPGFPNGSPLNEANAGFAIGQFGHWSIPLMSYPNARSPWGLMDVAGGTSEWSEEIQEGGSVGRFRVLDGSFAGTSIGNGSDRVNIYVSDFPNRRVDYGFRVAAAIPSCSTAAVMVAFAGLIGRHRRRSPAPGNKPCSSNVACLRR